MAESSLFDQVGGEVALTMIIDRFMERVFADPMIGFFFARADRARIKQKELELAAASLGARVSYTGRPLAAAHAPHPIRAAHFQRRLEILKQTLADFDVPESAAHAWLEHNRRLEAAIVQGDPNCAPGEPAREPPGGN
jgi:hemoglobin